MADLSPPRLWPFVEIPLREEGDPEFELGVVMPKPRYHLILSHCLPGSSAHRANPSASDSQNGQSRVHSLSIFMNTS